ncbi:hypothetical protein acdb102_41150 [Acidothermaceae bacterium B102]|nr:hypothetical protein acdb102_41150 [Acidothermaceae bacterium B102]
MRAMVRRWTVGPLLVALLLTATPAQASPHLTVRVAQSTVRVGGVVVVSGTASRGSVDVERRVGARWRPIARATVGRSGAYTMSLRAPANAITWQLRTTQGRTARRITVHVVSRSWVITAVTAPPVTSPDRIAVSGSVSPRSSGVVWLQAFSSGSWHDLGTAKLTSASTYLVHTTARPGIYTLRVRKSAGTTVAAGFSPASTVVVPVASPPVLPEPPAAAGNVVQAWGDDTDGELGDSMASETPDTTPTAVSGLSGVTAIAAGEDTGFALRYDGTVWAWGGAVSATAAAVPGLSDVTAVSAYGDTLLAVRSDGTVWTWTWGDGSVPAPVPGLSGITAVAQGQDDSYALAAGGTVWAWGNNDSGQLGNGTTDNQPIPVQVVGLAGVTRIAAGAGDAFALRNDGSVWAWGSNTYGGLGNGDTSGTDSAVPVQVQGVAGATAIAGGSSGGYAVVTGGAVMAWGNDGAGQLGTGGDGLFNPTPAAMVGVSGATAVASQGLTTYVLTSSGSVYAAGDNGEGQLATDLTETEADTPQLVPGVSNAIAVGAGLSAGYVLATG